MLTPSRYNIDARKDTQLLVISRADMLDLIGKIPALVEMIRLMDERYVIANNRRLCSTVSNTAEKRYEDLQKITLSLISVDIYQRLFLSFLIVRGLLEMQLCIVKSIKE